VPPRPRRRPRPQTSRRSGLVLIAALALVAGGCTDSGQRIAARAVERQAGVEEARCTRGARFIIQSIPTTVYVCDARVGGAQCDEYRVRLRKARPPAVTLRRRGVDCVLPVG
jgi:hypothetical protein